MKMGKREKIYLVVALTPWVLGLGLFYLWSQQLCTIPTPDNNVAVMVSTGDIEAGTVLEESHLRVKDVPAHFLPSAPLLERDFEIYLGETIAIDIDEHSLILTSDFQYGL